MSTEQQTKQPKYFMIIVKDEGYTCPEERDYQTNELITAEEYLPPAANPEQWWNENSDFWELCGGNTIVGILETNDDAVNNFFLKAQDLYKPVYLTDEEQKSIEEF